ncbi:MAG TPA: GNAT family N-acetyltransferase [Symbiobacteriaceae bacterium]|nr:GNAT family N-acetyltransferase [Symbiobacteriaceae bacterium]
MSFQLRPTTERDVSALAALITAQSSEPVSAESLQREDLLRPATDPYIRLGAFAENDKLLGFGFGWHAEDMAPGEFYCRVRVHATHQGQGVGRALWSAILTWLDEQGATSIVSGTLEADERANRVVQEAGFQVIYRLFESTLRLPDWEPAPWLTSVTTVEAGGIRFVTQAELGTSPEALRPFWTTSSRMSLDIPSNEHRQPLPFETWYRLFTENPHQTAEGVILALDGEQIVGVTVVAWTDSGALYNEFTGVDRAYRGRGIALALKVKALLWAQSTGAPYIRTNNHSVNGPMLAVNAKLGYKPEPGRLQVKLDL